MNIYEDAVKTWKVEVKSAQASQQEMPTPVELGHSGCIRRVARLLLDLAPEEVAPAQLQAASCQPPHAAAEQGALLPGNVGPGPGKKVLMSKVIDQGDDSEVTPFDADTIARLIEDWKAVENDGEEPTPEEEATGDQLVALQARLKLGATPFADFGVWRPYGNRFGRALRFVVQVLRPDGTYQAKEINGPPSFSVWLKCWTVFVFAMSTLKQAARTRLQRYADRIRKLNEDFPNYWWIIGLADIHMRSEHLERVRRKCVKEHAAGRLSDFDPGRPWDVVFREAALDDKFWHEEVDKKVLLFTSNIAPAARILDPGFGTIEESVAGQVAGRSGGGSTCLGSKRTKDVQSDSDSCVETAAVPKKKAKKRRRVSKSERGGPTARHT